MKKLIVAAAAIVFAVASQAAVVDWGYKITGDTTVTSAEAAQGSDYAKNYMVYLFAADAVADFSKLTKEDLSKAKDSAAIQYQSYSTRGGANYATANANNVVGNPRSFDVGNADSYAGVLVVVDTKNDTYNASEWTLTSRSETAGASTAGTKSMSRANFANQSFGQFSAVPEPTSGLLLLLGMAGLALKRKRA